MSVSNVDGPGNYFVVILAVVFAAFCVYLFIIFGGFKICTRFHFEQSPSNYRLQNDATFRMAEMQDL